MKQFNIDPDLERQLSAARGDDPVEAVLLLRPADGDGQPPDKVTSLMRRACGQDHHAELNYLPLMGALIVRARSAVIRMLISQPEVEMASANHLSGLD